MPGEERNWDRDLRLVTSATRTPRPATAPGEDRNTTEGAVLEPQGAALRLATAPGEDRNGDAAPSLCRARIVLPDFRQLSCLDRVCRERFGLSATFLRCDLKELRGSEVRPLWAHSPADGSDRWHRLEDHLRSAGELAARFARPFGGEQVAYWLGLLHDTGKASCAWQDKLAEVASTKGAVGIDHKALGTRLARERGLGPYALAVWGHHGGLIDANTLDAVVSKRLRENADSVVSAESAIGALLPELAQPGSVTPPAAWLTDRFVAEMAMRLVFSALCDADYLDTAAHFDGLAAPRVRPDADFGLLRDVFEKRRAVLLAGRTASRVDALRGEVYEGCVAAAAGRPGVFRLAAPTGAGKTIASAGFAVNHGALHGMRRVIVAVPFLTITEQNALVYRSLLDDESGQVVLEHHSGVDFDGGGPSRRWARLAAENWDAPFVVTTFVRLFESLYARKPAAMRRVHRLAGAVIVLDEVQALPHHLLVPILDGLRLLVDHFGTSVVLSSATQPDFWALGPFEHLAATDLVADHGRLVADLRRVRFEWRVDEPKPTLAQIAADAAEQRVAMVVVNTTADARACTTSGGPPFRMGWPGICRPACARSTGAGCSVRYGSALPVACRCCWCRPS